jgi:hypothetical protein
MMIGTRLARAAEGSPSPEAVPGPSLAAALRERMGLKLEAAGELTGAMTARNCCFATGRSERAARQWRQITRSKT